MEILRKVKDESVAYFVRNSKMVVFYLAGGEETISEIQKFGPNWTKHLHAVQGQFGVYYKFDPELQEVQLQFSTASKKKG